MRISDCRIKVIDAAVGPAGPIIDAVGPAGPVSNILSGSCPGFGVFCLSSWLLAPQPGPPLLFLLGQTPSELRLQTGRLLLVIFVPAVGHF